VSKRFPSTTEALEIIVKSGCSQTVVNHCRKVSIVAEKIAESCKNKGLKVDVHLVEIGALLHDIGRSKTNSINHPLIGANIARKFSLPEEVVTIIERHIGGGITANEAKQLGWPIRDYIPQTLEEKIVSYADKLVDGSRLIPIEQTLLKLTKQLGKQHPAISRVKAIHEELTSLIGNFDDKGHVA
jgi:uncharacterized protein